MPDERPEDLQSLWQNQKAEEIRMSTEEFRVKAERLRVKARRMAVANGVAYVAALGFLGFTFMKIPNVVSRAGLVMLAAGALYVAWRAHQRLWPSGGPSSETGIEAYHRELERSRDHLRDVWRMAAPMLPGAVLFVLPGVGPLVRMVMAAPRMALTNSLPFLMVMVVWLALMVPVRRRRLRKIQGEIEALERLGAN